MSTFVEKLKLAEQAAEDIYFAKVDRELIEGLHKPMRAKRPLVAPSSSARRRTGRTPRGGLGIVTHPG